MADDIAHREPADVNSFGPYEVVEALAQGGIGIVYRGRDLRSGEPVAIKLLLQPTPT
ncbi:MAG: hypothetical protein JKY65_14725 [Planctomycetes bacterium]|nr:hypothetical protein [Planctomycetota bacterium]